MKAKIIIENKFWILEEENGSRIGTIALKNNSVVAVIGNDSETFKNLDELAARYKVSFNKKSKPTKATASETEVYDFPTAHTPHNALWHVERKLPIYTKTSKSNSYHCAGYYIIKFEHGWVKSFSPKLITLQRYEYKGPFKSKLEMMEQLRLHHDTV
jgi:hypothetical protein